MAISADSLATRYTTHIEKCIAQAHATESRCTPGILQIDGMSGEMTRHLYNNICDIVKLDGSPTSYLEVGAWKGSSTISALYQNPCHATVIDNWSEFGAPMNEFQDNLLTFLGMPRTAKFSDTLAHPGQKVQLIDEDCFALKSMPMFAPYDIYLYDGHHSQESQRKGVVDLWDILADTCILIVDDWEWTEVKAGTYEGLAEVGAKVVASWDVEKPCYPSGREGFWNGSGIFVLQKAMTTSIP